MSDGHYRLLRSLLLRSHGPVKGGKGLQHHEVVVDFSRRGMVDLFRRLMDRITRFNRRVERRDHR